MSNLNHTDTDKTTRFLRQLFCFHVYKIIKEEFLYATGTRDIKLYEYYAVTEKCLKCDRERMRKQEYYA